MLQKQNTVNTEDIKFSNLNPGDKVRIENAKGDVFSGVVYTKPSLEHGRLTCNIDIISFYSEGLKRKRFKRKIKKFADSSTYKVKILVVQKLTESKTDSVFDASRARQQRINFMKSNFITNKRSACVSYYAILGISISASQEEIKKAYRKLALKFHPDKNKDNAKAAEIFIKCTEAYDILSNQELRKNYDYSLKFSV